MSNTVVKMVFAMRGDEMKIFKKNNLLVRSVWTLLWSGLVILCVLMSKTWFEFISSIIICVVILGYIWIGDINNGNTRCS
jgi:hypothetical protein